MKHTLIKTLSISLIAFSAFTFSADRVIAQEAAPDAAVVDILPLAPLTSVQAVPSNNIIYTKGYYTIALNTATAGAIKKIEATFPANFNLGNAKLIETANIGAGGILISGLPATGQTLTYTISALTPPNVPAGTKIRLMIGDIINNGVTVAQSVSVTTKDSGGLVIDGPNTSTNPALTKVTAAMIADNAVTTAKIAANAVDGTKIAPAAVGPGQISNGAIQSNHILDGQVSIADLAFDPATQAELDAHKLSADHDGRYFTEAELNTAGTINTVTNPVDWTKLKSVPAGFADGIDNTGGTASDVVCTGCVDSTDIADAGISNVDLAAGSYPNITGVGTLGSLAVSGNVGIGTTSPSQKLHVAGAFLRVDGAGGEQAYLGGDGAGSDVQLGSLNLGVTNVALYNATSGNYMNLYANGLTLSGVVSGALNVGLFGVSPATGRVVASGSMAELSFVKRSLTSWPSLVAAGDRYVWYNPDGSARFWTEVNGDLLTITRNGNVGIGETAPDSTLNVKYMFNNYGSIRVGGNAVDTSVEKRIRFGDGDYVAIGEQVGKDDAMDIKARTGIYLDTSQGGLFFPNSYPARPEVQGGNVISFGHPGFSEDQIYYSNNTFHFRDSPGGGDTLEPVIEVGAIRIIGGADIAEPFDVKDNDAIMPGMVMAIDVEHPGELRIADRSYDHTVAGVISGANGLNPGVVMVKDGMTDKNSAPVALTGRVYTYVDASYGVVKPGDLLTTSDTPGHAMKVTDYNKAQGAIIGKAMSTLTEGKGLVLVLVSLQ
ncbi:MAG: hypothetical protein HZA08_06730 [Nitrospirae bacterium]|nr:hypothetical protein [Nitrospirota bacterium]